MGTNRTGIASSPVEAQAMIEGTREASPPGGDGLALEEVRVAYSRDAVPLGTMPPPASLTGVADAAIAMMEGKRATAFLDLLGARLAFERAGTRLYEALLVKLAAADPRPEGPTREDLERLRDDEARHFVLLKRAIEELGGDPTVMTPGADVVGVSGAGWVQVLADPRTTLTEGLKTILQAELVDGEQWLMLADIALRLGHLEMAEHFRAALAEEEEHLDLVRGWVVSSVESQIGLEADTRDESPQVPAP
jgi:hypothetical protein